MNEETEVGYTDAVAGNRRDDAAGHRLTNAERIADGQRNVAHLDGIGVAELDDRKASVAVNFQNRQIEPLILEQNPALKFPPIGKCDPDIIRTLNDVVVGHDDAVGLDDHAGPE